MDITLKVLVTIAIAVAVAILHDRAWVRAEKKHFMNPSARRRSKAISFGLLVLTAVVFSISVWRY